MLTRDSLNVAMPLATVLDSRDLIIVPVPGTPLEALVNSTRSDPNFNLSAESGFTPDVDSIEYIANAKDPVLGTSKHDMVFDELVEVISNSVRGHVVFAKNVVAPAVEDLVKRVTTSLNELTPSSLLGMEVITWAPPKPLLNSSLETAINKFEEVPFDVPAMNLNLPTITANDVVELMKSGSGSLDKDIAEWAASKGDTFFINIWENVFQIKQAKLTDRVVTTFRNWIYDNDECLDVALAIYLLSRKLADNPLPETTMNLNTFNKTIIEFRNQSAARLSIAIKDLNKVDKIQQLVRGTNDRTITVNESVYRKWIEAGGENEVLFGNLLSLSKSVTVGDINSKAETLKDIWNHHSIVTATIERNRLFTRTKELLMKHFSDQMREVPEGDEATLANRETIIKLFMEELDNIREDELANIWDVALKLLCHSRFNKTDARRILLGIERVKKENPEAHVRECAAISMIEYISYWLSTQMKVTSAL